jgi:enoyl-[acyl-carrier protein] reductase III
MFMEYKDHNLWTLVLGGSSGIGLASAQELARLGFNIVVVHRDRQSRQPSIDAAFNAIRSVGVQLISCNLDALSACGRDAVLGRIEREVGKGQIRVLVHSIALGNLKPAIQPPTHPDGPTANVLAEDDYSQTIYNMGSSLMFWCQDLLRRQLFSSDARVFGLTSSGNSRVLPGYAAVSAAKNVLESIARTIAVEFAPYGVRCNILQPGVTDTPALRLIPGAASLIEKAIANNPYKRLTLPTDVAKIIALLSRNEAAWVNGSLIHVNGGEHLTS